MIISRDHGNQLLFISRVLEHVGILKNKTKQNTTIKDKGHITLHYLILTYSEDLTMLKSFLEICRVM